MRWKIEVGILRIVAIVRNPLHRPFLVRAFVQVEPTIGSFQMFTHPKAQPLLPRRRRPEPDDVLVRPHVHRVPLVIL